MGLKPVSAGVGEGQEKARGRPEEGQWGRPSCVFRWEDGLSAQIQIAGLVTRLGSQLERYLVLCHAEILGTGCERQKSMIY